MTAVFPRQKKVTETLVKTRTKITEVEVDQVLEEANTDTMVV